MTEQEKHKKVSETAFELLKTKHGENIALAASMSVIMALKMHKLVDVEVLDKNRERVVNTAIQLIPGYLIKVVFDAQSKEEDNGRTH